MNVATCRRLADLGECAVVEGIGTMDGVEDVYGRASESTEGVLAVGSWYDSGGWASVLKFGIEEYETNEKIEISHNIDVAATAVLQHHNIWRTTTTKIIPLIYQQRKYSSHPARKSQPHSRLNPHQRIHSPQD